MSNNRPPRTTSAQHLDEAADPTEKSKSQRKREMSALQDLAAELLLLPKNRYANLSLNEDLVNALETMHQTRSHEGRRRHMQYIGKLMRHLDENDIAAIHTAIDDWKGIGKAQTILLHRLENWRAELLANDQALTELLHDHPSVDAQALRTTIRNARKEVADNKPPHHFRELYRILKELVNSK